MNPADFPRQLARTGRLSFGLPRALTVSPDGRRVLFLRTQAGDDPSGLLWLYRDGAERVLADPARLPAAPGGPPPEELARRERTRERSAGVVAYATDAEARTAVFALDGRLWIVDTAGGGPRPVPTPGPVTDPRPDPAGRRIAYVSGGALHVVDPATGTDRVLASPEGPDVGYGLAEYAAMESMGRLRGHWWAPDGSRLLVARVDESAVRRWWLADPAHPERPARSRRYPVAGTANAEVRLFVITLEGERHEVVWDRAAYEYLATAGWDAHGPLLTVQSRDQRTADVLAADPGTGATTLLHRHRDPAWVELVPGTPARTASGALVHARDDAGTRRLCVGGEPVTPDGLQVDEVLRVAGERVLFTASTEPTEVHVWSWEPRTGPVRLSAEPGMHGAAAGGEVIVLDSRTPRGRTATVLRDGRPAGILVSLAEEPLVTPRITWLCTGPLELRTALLLPSWHRPGSGRLPVLAHPYGGAGLRLAVRTRDWWLCEAQWYAEAGFAVVVADGRGTPGRGPAWEKAFHGDKITAALEDQVTAVRGAAGRCQDLDTTRVGIRGWSYGGYLAAAAVLRRPDVFHAAVAGAPAFDQRLYDTHWQERFLGLPQEHPERYDRSSLLPDAPNLRRPLLIVHGLADDNVTVAHTLRMSAALLAAGRPHSVLPLAGAGHAVRQEKTAVGLMLHQLDFLRGALGVPAREEPLNR